MHSFLYNIEAEYWQIAQDVVAAGYSNSNVTFRDGRHRHFPLLPAAFCQQQINPISAAYSLKRMNHSGPSAEVANTWGSQHGYVLSTVFIQCALTSVQAPFVASAAVKMQSSGLRTRCRASDSAATGVLSGPTVVLSRAQEKQSYKNKLVCVSIFG